MGLGSIGECIVSVHSFGVGEKQSYIGKKQQVQTKNADILGQ